MGRPNVKRRSAQRLGKHERARVKKEHRGSMYVHVGGVGISYEITAGRKKFRKVYNYLEKFIQLIGDSGTVKSGTVIKRPLYKITVD